MAQQGDNNTAINDPSLYLDDDCMSQVFSFVGGVAKNEHKTIHFRKNKQRRLTHRYSYELPGPGPYWGVKEAAYLCCVLAAVSPKWEQLVNQSTSDIISVPIDLNLDEFKSEESARTWLSWLCQHKASIGKLRSRHPRPSLTTELINLLQECDTSKLVYMELYLAKDQEELQNTIVQQCPNIQTLTIYASAQEEPALHGLLSPSLASLPSIEELEICLIISKFDLSEKDGMLLNQLVEKVVDITPLDQGTLEILSLRHPKELRFEPIGPTYDTKKCALALTTERSFRSDTFGFR